MPTLTSEMETRRLTNSDMRKLVRIFSGWPAAASKDKEDSYRKYTKQDIHDLPRRLRSSALFTSSTNLCSIHMGLDAHLTNDIWAWLRHEVDYAIGKFLYPVIMSGRLTAAQELKARQLEPVLEMWHSDFTQEGSAPFGHYPINCSFKWIYQIDQCPGCMLARIGSDGKALFALFAGMVGHFNMRSLTTNDMIRSVVGWEKTRSKRIRFVRYWIQNLESGDTILFEAGDLGLEMKQLRRELKHERRRLRHVDGAGKGRPSLDSTTAHTSSTTAILRPSCGKPRPQPTDNVLLYKDARQHEGQTASIVDVDLCEPYQQKNWMPTGRDRHDGKLGPVQLRDEAKQHSPAAPVGFDMSGLLDVIPKTPNGTLLYDRPGSHSTNSSIRPGSSGSVRNLYPPPLRVRHRQHMKAVAQDYVPTYDSNVDDRADSVFRDQLEPTAKPYEPSMVSTILSYDGAGVSAGHSRGIVDDPLDRPTYNRIETPEDRIQKYRDLLARQADAYADPFDDDASFLPVPKRQSMYSSFGTGPFEDYFATVDEEILEQEMGNENRTQPDPAAAAGATRHQSDVSTTWGGLY